MIRINLLPHREQARQARLRRFVVLAVASVVAGLAVVGVGYTALSAQIATQAERNQFLKDEITKLDKQIAEIDTLKKERQQLLDRKRVVERLQMRRGEVVQALDQLIRQTPEGVYYTSVKQSEDVITLEGLAQSSARVSTLMRSLNDSPMFESPVLVQIKAATGGGKVQDQMTNQFSLNVNVTRNLDVVTDKTGKPGKTGGKP